MKKALALILMTAVTACSPKIVERVVEKEVIKDRIIHDTTTFTIPVEIEKIVTRDTASHLENKYAESDAVVSGGFLSHSLKTRPQVIKVPVEVEVHDTTYIKGETTTVFKNVEKPLSASQKFRIGSFWWLLGLVVVGFRRELLSLVKTIIKLF